jgi:hypothetical protein
VPARSTLFGFCKPPSTRSTAARRKRIIYRGSR